MDDLKKQIEDAITQTLPAQIGTALKDRLIQADRDAAELVRTKEHLADSLQKIKQHEAMSKREAAILDREVKAKAWEAELAERSVTLRLTEQRAEFAEKRADFAKEIVGMVFANNRYKYQELLSGSVPVAIPSGSYPQQQSSSSTKTVEGEQ